MIDTIQTAGPYVLAFWFGGAFGFVVCAFFAGSRILERQATTNMIYVETSLFPLLRFATIIGFGFTLGILGAAEVVWILWALVQVAKGLM